MLVKITVMETCEKYRKILVKVQEKLTPKNDTLNYLCNFSEKIILNLVSSNQSRIVITLHRLIYHLTEFNLLINLSEKCNYNPNLVEISKTKKNKKIALAV